MERLTRKLSDGTAYTGAVIDASIADVNYPTYIGEAVDKLAAYEDAEEQGLLLRLPCKVGDTIYEVSYENRKYIIREHVVNQFVYISYREPRIEIYCERENGFLLSSITGKLDEGLFLTREEAEAKLKEMEGSHDGE